MPTRRQLIQKIELNSDQSSVTFSGIPQNYTDLKIVINSRSSRLDTFEVLAARFNAASDDTNHTSRYLLGSGSAASSGTNTYCRLGLIPANSATSSTFGNLDFYLPNYSGSTNKSYVTKSVMENNATLSYIDVVSGLWSNTEAITGIELRLVLGSNFIAGSTFYLYGITHVPIIRGGEEYVLDGFKYHKFTSTAALQVIEPGDVEYLVVAGGGGGGYAEGGGGGAGGLLNGRIKLSPSVYSVAVGAGGVGSTSNSAGSQGSLSSLSSISCTGGGGGGSNSTSVGGAGGSGGGGANSKVGGSGISGQGNNGGSGVGYAHAAGGGGSSAAGGNSSTNAAGNGGAGSIVFGSYYAGGGGGSTWFTPAGTAGAGGIGGGGAGVVYNNSGAAFTAYSGIANTGGGGGGGGYGISAPNASQGGSGGSGIVIIRYPYDGN